MKLSLKTLYHQGKKISFAHQVLILHFCRNWAVHCHIVIVKMYSRTLAYNYVDKWAGALGRKRFIFTRGFASKCFKAHKKTPATRQAERISNHSNNNGPSRQTKMSKREKVICIKRGKKTSDQGAVGYGFASDWSKAWCEFSEPITKRNEAKPL